MGAGPTAAGALGAGGGAAGSGVGVATTSIGPSAALKATSIAAAVTIGAGAAGVTGTVHLPVGSPAHNPTPAVSTPAPTTPAPAHRAAGHSGPRDHGTGTVAHTEVSPGSDVSTGQHGPKPSSENAARGDSRQAAGAGGHARGARPSVAEPPANPPHGRGANGSSNGAGNDSSNRAGGNGSSNGAAAPGRGRSAAAPPSHSPPRLEQAASHSHSSHSHSLPEQARGAPASPPQAHGPSPGHGHHS